LSFVVDKNIIADDIIKIINENPLISELNVIDVYENLENGKKSLTFRLSYQSFNETLSNKQIEESQNKTLKLLKKNLNVELRKQI
jgi:phenylalanyl-tRNA synthetase beta chain